MLTGDVLNYSVKLMNCFGLKFASPFLSVQTFRLFVCLFWFVVVLRGAVGDLFVIEAVGLISPTPDFYKHMNIQIL